MTWSLRLTYHHLPATTMRAEVATVDGPCRILVVMPTWVGDAVLATPLLEAVHRALPGAVIDLLSKRQLRGLLDGTPWLHSTIEWQKTDGLWSLARRLRAQRYDWGILLSNSFRPALVLWLARVRRRVGYSRNGRGWLLTDRLSFPAKRPFRMVDFYGALGQPLGVSEARGPLRLYLEPAARAKADALFAATGLATAGPIVALNPGAKYGSSKLWPAAHFAQVGDALAERQAARIVVLAGPGEDELASDIIAQMRHPAVTFPSPEVTLATLKAVVARLDLMVTNDTGPRHIAAALGVPTVTIFGPTHRTWGDSGFQKSAELSLDVECGPCMQRTCPLGHHKCMRDLPAAHVIEAAQRLLSKLMCTCATPRVASPIPSPGTPVEDKGEGLGNPDAQARPAPRPSPRVLGEGVSASGLPGPDLTA